MADFQLDTSGYVTLWNHGGPWPHRKYVRWSDLDAFTQGYAEALFASLSPRGYRYETGSSAPEYRPWAFSDLAPKTLAAILKDCAEVAPDGGMKGYPPGNASAEADARGAGAEFWRRRNRLTFKRFPPLTPYLGDDGRVYLKEGSDA